MVIYLITNKINGRKYVGQTLNFKTRMKQHKSIYDSQLKEGGYVSLIDRKIKQYGEHSFTFEIIDTAKTQDELDNKEKFYIMKYESHVSKWGYNIKWGGAGGGKHSDETKLKIGISQIGELNHMYGIKGVDHHSSKRVKDIFNNKIYDSATTASLELSIQQSKICACARGERISVGGYVFRYIDEEGNEIPPVGDADYKVKCIDTNEIFDSTAIAEYEISGKITGGIARVIPRGHKYKGYKFEKVC